MDFFDASLLADADFSCILLTDLHFIPQEGIPGSDEFPCRGKQTARSRTALQIAGGLPADLAFHLGDFTQAFPESPGFDSSMTAAQAAIAAAGHQLHTVAGNQDIGDKPDPTMPTRPVDAHTLALFENRFGPTWYSLSAGGVRWIVVNSQILNRPDLPQWKEQRQWLETTLAEAAQAGERIFLLLHLPPYIHDPAEPGLGHYDNIGRPDRDWLLDLIRRHRVQRWFCGHVHWRFYDHFADCIGQTCPSTAFTRPGFSTAFTSEPPPEQGRNDEPKLGFLLLRIGRHFSETLLIRTGGMEKLPSAVSSGEQKWLLTRPSGSIEHSPLGATLIHPLAAQTQTPLAWPSSIRQPLRNDYPLLSLIELGARHLRVMDVDWRDAAQRRRLEIARAEGIDLTATRLYAPQDFEPAETWDAADASIGYELRLPGGVVDAAVAERIRQLQSAAKRVSLSPVIPNDQVPGKQHLRTRHGFTLEELPAVDEQLTALGLQVDRVVCRIGVDQSPWAFFGELEDLSLKGIGALDVTMQLSTSDRENARNCGEAMMGCAALPGARLFIEPLLDMDRTMDVRHGLLDAQSNPRPPFFVLRSLNTILFSRGRDWRRVTGKTPQVRRDGITIAYAVGAQQVREVRPGAPLRLYRLEDGTVSEVLPAEVQGPVAIEWTQA